MGVLVVSPMLGGCGESDAVVENTRWTCKATTCEVSFSLVNRTNDPLEVNYAIRAHRRVRIPNTEGFRNLVVGEEKAVIALDAREVHEVNRTLSVQREPSAIVATVWRREE